MQIIKHLHNGTNLDWKLELSRRRRSIWSMIEDEKCDIGLIFANREHPEAFRYLTNYVPTLGDMWGIQRSPETMTCILNFHWELNEARQISGLEDWHGYFDPLPFLQEQLSEIAPQRIAVLGFDRLPWRAVQNIQGALPGAQWIDLGEHFARLRRIKTPMEIQLLRKAVQITDGAIQNLIPDLRPGCSEIDLAAQIAYYFHQNNADAAFSPLVMGGNDKDTAVIARKTRQRPLEAGDSLMLDIGASFQGYQADVGRTYTLGTPNRLQQQAWDTILQVYDTVLTLARPGVPCNELHQAALKIYAENGFQLIHRIGHGFGLATSFEWPSLDSETSPLKPGMTLAIEPSIYLVGAGAMKLEDDVLITENGNEVLSNCSRQLKV